MTFPQLSKLRDVGAGLGAVLPTRGEGLVLGRVEALAHRVEADTERRP